MKIAILIGALKVGGAERQAILTAKELARLGHQVDLVIYNDVVEYDQLLSDLDIKPIVIAAKGKVAKFTALYKLFRRNAYDVVHTFCSASALYAAFAGKAARVPLIFGGYRVEYKSRGIYRLLHKFAGKVALDGWIVNSKTIVDSMVKPLGLNTNKFAVLYNGIPIDSFQCDLDKKAAKEKLGLTDQHKVITMIARMHPQKNHRLFIDMAKIVSEKNPNIHFLLVGDGPAEEEIKSYAKSVGISEHISFLGRRSDVPEILAATDISVLTSDFEGFPNTLIEAMSVGKPIVTTDYPGIDELVEDQINGLIVPMSDAQAFADAVCRLLDDQDLAEKVGSNAKEYVLRNLTPAAMAENLMKIYDRFRNNK